LLPAPTMSNNQIEDPEELLEGTVKEVKSTLRDAENPDYQKIKDLEEEGKDRKTLKEFLDSHIDNNEEQSKDSEEPEESEEQQETEEESDENEESEEEQDSEDESSSSSSSGGKEKKLQQVLDDLDELQSVEGAAVVRRDGLLIASNFSQDFNEDQVGAMTASTVGSGETASDSLNLGDVNEVTIESKNGKLVSTGAGDQGVLAVLTDADVNMGLVKVEMEKATDKIKRVL
jgi:predicted regulator of Ras-like GTPase activity (Roadblock/LC7/MglB family)